MSNQQTIKGTVEKLIYQNKDTWYSVCDVFTSTEEAIVVVGIMPYIAAGEEIEASGIWVTNKEYGRQFKVDEYNKILPKKKNSILRYLSSGAIKGVGPKTAKKIVDQYGEDSFEVIANHPEWLMQIDGISRKKAYEISFDFNEKSDIRDILTISNGAISSTDAVKVYKRWGKNSIGMLKENPYCLCTDQFGISFKRADEIAFSFGASYNDPNRIEAGLRYVLEVYASRDGHTYVKTSQLKESACKLLNVNMELIEGFFANGCTVRGVSGFVYENEPCVALNELYFAEINVSKRLLYLNSHITRLDNRNVEYMIEELELRDGIKYANLQKKAIFKALENGISILTGGPGTGKTTVIRALMNIFNRYGMTCVLCAPTGRAAKRMSEATGEEAKTIHRLLEFEPPNEYSDQPSFLRNDSNPIDADVIIVDESSMVDIRLMNSLLTATKAGSRIVFIGDINQLPSVGEGNVLFDMIGSGVFSVVSLNEIFRQSQGSGIVVNAHKINRGIYPDLTEKYDDFFFVDLSEDKVPEYIANLYKNRLPKKYGEDAIEKIQVISPTKKGLTGVSSLNVVLQEALNPAQLGKSEIKRGETHIFRAGDKVMQLHNNYEVEWIDEKALVPTSGKGVFNGDIGKVIYVDDENFSIDFQGRRVDYSRADIEQIDHSYAITVHKSQGSEYPFVIIPVTSQCPPLLRTRNLIYTAITRAEKMVILVGSKNVFFEMINNDMRVKRNTLLSCMLVGEI